VPLLPLVPLDPLLPLVPLLPLDPAGVAVDLNILPVVLSIATK
jgi:hypothetical protein